jgi:hypothetical protein
VEVGGRQGEEGLWPECGEGDGAWQFDFGFLGIVNSPPR